MTINTKFNNVKTIKANIKQAIINKGVDVGSNDEFSTYPTKISQISGGGVTPTGTINISTNGTYNVTNYASANVSVSGGNLFGREIIDGVLSYPSTFTLPNGVTDLSSYTFRCFFYNNKNLTSANLSSLTTVSGNYALSNMFYNCTSLTSVDLSNLTTVSGARALSQAFVDTSVTVLNLSNLTTVSGAGAFENFYNHSGTAFSGLTSLDLSSLTTVTGQGAFYYAFRSCTSIASINFSNLLQIGENSSSENCGHFAQAFNGCTRLTSITFPKLEKIYCTGKANSTTVISGYAGTFASNNKVQKMYFPKLDTITYGAGASEANQAACEYVFYGCAALTELHFAAANQAAIEASPGYSTAWGRGAGNVTIYFDL